MKTTMKKLAVFGMIVTIAMFTVVAMASAGDNRWNTIIGEYGFSGGGNCIFTPISNWDTTKNAIINPALVAGASYTSYGIVTFEPKGKGSVKYTAIQTPNPPAWSPVSVDGSYTFTYEFKYDDVIFLPSDLYSNCQTQTYPAPASTTCRDHNNLIGYISADKKTIEFAAPAVEVDTLSLDATGTTPVAKLICNAAYIGSRLDD